MNNPINDLDNIFNPLPPAIKKIWPSAKVISMPKPVKRPKDEFLLHTKNDTIKRG